MAVRDVQRTDPVDANPMMRAVGQEESFTEVCDRDPVIELKRQLADEIRRLVAPYAQDVAAAILGVRQPRVSDIMLDKLDRFSLQRLVRLLARMDRKVEIRVSGSASPFSVYFKKRFAARRARRGDLRRLAHAR